MILGLIKQKQRDLSELLFLFKENKVKNTALFMLSFDNLDALTAASDLIDKSINQDLIDINKKVLGLIEEYKSKNKDIKVDDSFEFGLTLLSEEEQKKRRILEEEFNRDMMTLDREVKLSVIPRELIENIDFEVDDYNKIRFFFDSKNWESKQDVNPAEKKKKVKR